MNTAHEDSWRSKDFPSFVPPLLVKELRQGLRTKGFVIFLIVFPLLMALPFLVYILAGAGIAPREMINTFFWGFVILFFLVFNPLRALSAVSQEKVTRSNELIMMTSMSSSGIVREKWISYTLQTILLALVIMPFMLLRYFLGGVEIIPELVIMAAIFTLTIVLLALGIWVSGMPLPYKVLYAISVIFLVVGGPVFFVASSMIPFNGIGAEPGLLCLSFGVLVVILFFLCRSFLVLASRWFAAPAENTAFDFRRQILWMSAATLAGNLLLWAVDSEMAKIPTTLVILNCFYFFCLVSMFWVEMVLPAELLPAHVLRMKESGWFWRKTRSLWLPGWQSAGLFFLIVMILFCCMFMFLLERETEKGMTLVLAVLLIWADVTLTVMVLQILWKKLKIHSLIVFPVLMLFLLLVSAMAKASWGGDMDFDLLISIIPAGNLLTLDSRDSMLQMSNYIFTGIVFLAFLAVSIPYRDTCRQFSRGCQGQKNKEDMPSAGCVVVAENCPESADDHAADPK